LLDQIKERWRLLADHPYAGPSRDDIAPGVRHLVIGEYLTLYRVTDDTVEILRVLHGRRYITGSDIGP
jgi:toxin ParE1/3/4